MPGVLYSVLICSCFKISSENKKRSFSKEHRIKEVVMSDILKNTLAEGEKILWEGRPEKITLFEAKSKAKLILKWLICGFIRLGVTIAVITAALVQEVPLSLSMFVLIFIVLVVCAYIALYDFFDIRKVNNNIRYFISDRNYIIAFSSDTIYSLPKKNCKISERRNELGNKDICIGSYSDKKGKSMYKYSFRYDFSEGNVYGFIFFNVKDTEELSMAMK